MRPSSFSRGGGGALNDVDLTIQGYQIVQHTESYEIKTGNRKGDQFTPLNIVLSLLVDGASDVVTRRLLIGEATDFAGVSADGLTLSLGEGRFSAKSEAGQFIDSLVEAGFDANEFDEDPSTLNLEPIVGRRFHTVQVDVVDEKGVAKTHVGKGQDGKPTTFRDKVLKVSKVYDGVAVKVSKKAVAKGGKALKPGTAAKIADVAVEAAEALLAVVAAKGGVILKTKLRMALLTALTGKTDNRDAIIAYLAKDENLDAVEGIEHDGEAISAAA